MSSKEAEAQPPMFLRMSELCSLIGLKSHAIDRAIRAGQFPRPFLIGVKAKAWKRAEIDAWIAQQDAARAGYIDPAVPNPLTEAERAARYEAANRDAA
ncbi:AlpA family phage regulatory protein [uncultured Sphingomonas sp.]|uniref:helix-turn-helix transcriptional regulator n=1 Tax=uncultured Sphingomonas sp. TaxID=158754 RepID=UPI0025FC45D8|nr:AlpA family phage regulatory protein [uncultured Sphingomonas sp.]